MEKLEPIYDLRISEDKKYKDDGKFFRDYMDYIIPYDTTIVDEYEDWRMNYDLINDNIDGFKDKLKEFCAPRIPEDLSKEIELDSDIEHYGRIFSKYQYLNGSFLSRRIKFYPSFTNQEAIEEKESERRRLLDEAISERMQIMFEAETMKQNGASESEINQYMTRMISTPDPEKIASTDFKSETEKFLGNVIDMFYNRFEFYSMASLGFKHLIATDTPVFYIGEEHGKTSVKCINPLHFGYHKAPDEIKIEKGDYAWSRTALTISEIYNLYGDILSEEEIQTLSTYTYSSNLAVNERHHVIGNPKNDAKVTYDPTSTEIGLSIFGKQDKLVGQAMGGGVNRKYNQRRLIWRCHFEFKAFKSLYFLTYMNEFGKEVTEVLSDKFEIPSNATEVKFINRYGKNAKKYEWVDNGVVYSAELISIPRRYEVTRLGQNIYINFREVPNQPLNIDDPYGSFELSYKGRVFTGINSKSKPLVSRARPHQFEYDLIKNLQLREMIKYEGYQNIIDVSQLPKWMTFTEEGEPLPDTDILSLHRHFRRIFGEAVFDSSQDSMGLPNPQKSRPITPTALGSFVDVLNMQQALDYIDREIGLSMGIPLQAEGQIAPHSNASDNERILKQGYTMIEPYFIEYENLLKSVVQEYVRQFRIEYQRFFEDNPDITETYLTYVSGIKSTSILKITPELLDFSDMTLFVTNDNSDNQYREIMMSPQMLQAFAQNRGEGMDGISLLVKAITSGESPQDIHDMIKKLNKEQQQREQEMMMQQQQMQQNQSNDADDIPPEVEIEDKMIDMEKKRNEIENSKRKLDQDDRKLDIEQEKISVMRNKATE